MDWIVYRFHWGSVLQIYLTIFWKIKRTGNLHSSLWSNQSLPPFQPDPSGKSWIWIDSMKPFFDKFKFLRYVKMENNKGDRKRKRFHIEKGKPIFPLLEKLTPFSFKFNPFHKGNSKRLFNWWCSLYIEDGALWAHYLVGNKLFNKDETKRQWRLLKNESNIYVAIKEKGLLEKASFTK